MGKKIAIGCLLLLVVGVAVGGFVAYRYVYQPARDYVASLTEFAEVSELDQNVESREAYTPPADELLTQGQLDRMLRVQRHIESRLGNRQAELQEKYRALTGGEQQAPSFSEVMEALRDLGGLVRDAKEAQVEALNQEGFSLEEYDWVKNEVYRSLGQSVVSLNLEKLSEAVSNQDPSVLTEESDTSAAPDANQQLVDPHRDELMKGLIFASFGL